MPNSPSFYVHEKADSDLEDIFDYSVENFGFACAEQYVYEIEQVLGVLHRTLSWVLVLIRM